MSRTDSPGPFDKGLPKFTKTPPRPNGNLARHAWDELNRAGLFTHEGDFYGGMTGRAVLELVETLDAQNHSGMSAGIVIDLFQRLARFKALSPLTDDPAEWMEVTDGLWQSRRTSEAFSDDRGRTYRLNSSRDVVHRSEPAVAS